MLINEWSGLYTTIYRAIDKYYGLDYKQMGAELVDTAQQLYAC